DQLLGVGNLYVAHNDQHGVVGCVIGFEKLRDIVQRGGVEILERADQRVRILPVLKYQLRPVVDDGGGIGLVVEAQSPLLFDGLLLVGQILRGKSEAAHAVGFEPQSDRQFVGRHDFVVIREIGVCGTV